MDVMLERTVYVVTNWLYLIRFPGFIQLVWTPLEGEETTPTAENRAENPVPCSRKRYVSVAGCGLSERLFLRLLEGRGREEAKREEEKEKDEVARHAPTDPCVPA
jgi:hypothetical protein